MSLERTQTIQTIQTPTHTTQNKKQKTKNKKQKTKTKNKTKQNVSPKRSHLVSRRWTQRETKHIPNPDGTGGQNVYHHKKNPEPPLRDDGYDFGGRHPKRERRGGD